jgi:ribonuclease D
MSPLWIDTAAALAEACARWQSREWIALDTEFVRIDTYHARLCLVQVGDGETDACIDTLALEDLSPLWALLQAPGVLKLLHSSSQDLEIFVERTGQTGGPIFDTQIAATLLGYGDQIGYAALVERCLGETVDKSLSRTDWARRPLKAAEIAYAADDVRHLAALYPALREAVTAAGRLPWLEADCAALTDPARYRTAPDDAWQRLKGLGRLDPASQTRAVALAAWRERQAQQRNRPRRWILEDAALYRIAERAPTTPAALEALAVLPPKTLERHGAALIDAVQTAAALPAQRWMADELAGEDKARFKRLQAVVREAAERLHLPPGFLAPRSELEALVRQGAEAPVGVLQGWRGEQLGAALREALQAG